MAEETVRTTISLPSDVRKKAENAAAAQCRSLSNYILWLIEMDTAETAGVEEHERAPVSIAQAAN